MRAGHGWPSVVMVATAAVVAGCGAGGSAPTSGQTHGGAAASCVGPRLSVAPSAVRAGDTVRASGEWFAADCYDTGQAGTPPPLTRLTLVVSQGGHTWTVASGVDAAGQRYTFRLPIVLPEALKPGAASVAVNGYGAPARVVVRPR